MLPMAALEEILRQCLRLVAACLKEYIGEEHYFEVSVFVDGK